MSDAIKNDPNPALRAEYVAAAGVLEPKLHGLSELLKAIDPGPLHDFLSREYRTLSRKFNLINATLAQLDGVVAARNTLDATGYPAVEPLPLPPELYAELQTDLEALRIAGSIFVSGPGPAVGITATLTPIPKT
jgi:hypothetical protein